MATYTRGLMFEDEDTLLNDIAEQETHYQRESEMETDPVGLEIHAAQNMLVGNTHHRALIAQCKEELDRVMENIRLGNCDAATSLMVKYHINIRDRDLILAVEGRDPGEFLREIDQAIMSKRLQMRK